MYFMELYFFNNIPKSIKAPGSLGLCVCALYGVHACIYVAACYVYIKLYINEVRNYRELFQDYTLRTNGALKDL